VPFGLPHASHAGILLPPPPARGGLLIPLPPSAPPDARRAATALLAAWPAGGRGAATRYLDISGSDASDRDAAGAIARMPALTTLVARRSHLGGFTFIVLGTPAALLLRGLAGAGAGPPPPGPAPPVGAALEALDLSACLALAKPDARLGALLAAALGRLPALRALALREAHVGGLLDALAAALDAAEAAGAAAAAAPGSSSPSAAAAAAAPAAAVPLLLLPSASPAGGGGSGGGVVAAFGRLRQLDLSHAAGLSPAHVAAVLAAGGGLHTLLATGLRGFAASGGEDAALAALRGRWPVTVGGGSSALPPLPSLRRLALGWGFGDRTLCLLAAASAATLTSLTAAAGASLSDAGLAAVATRCRELRQLSLVLCAVSEAGVAPLLRANPRLQSLRLSECVGPFGAAMLPPAADAGGGGRASLVFCRLEGGGRCPLSSAQLAALLGARRVDALQCLSIVGAAALCDRFLAALAGRAAALQHLRLEECSRDGDGGGSQPAFSAAALLTLAAAAPRLRSLRLRHCSERLGEGFVPALVAAAPLLHHLTLDACDLEGGGFRAACDAHSALETAAVFRCRCVEDALGRTTRVGARLLRHSLLAGTTEQVLLL